MNQHSHQSPPHTRRRSWPWIAGVSLLVTAVAAFGIVRFGGGDDSGRLTAGSRVGYHDPFATRRRVNVEPVWAHDFMADPTEMVVDGVDTFVVTPTAVTALETDSGATRWQADVKDAEPYLAVDARVVAVGAVDGFELLDRTTGASRWRSEISDPTDRARGVAIVGPDDAGVVIGVTDHNGVIGLDAASGAPRWTSPASAPPRGRLVADSATGSVVTLNGNEAATQLRVLDARSGAVRWSAELGPDTGIPMIVGSSLLVVTGDDRSGGLRALAVADGHELWQRRLTTGAWSTMGLTRVGNDVIAVDAAGTATSVAVATGTLRWQTELPGPVLADSPAVIDDLLVVHDTFAEIHTLDPRSGRLLGSRQSVGVPIALGAGAHRVVYAQSEVQYGQVIAYAPDRLRRPVGTR